MKDSEKEKTKLLATLFNGLAVTTITLGFVTPLIGLLYGAVTAPPLGALLLKGSIWLGAGLVLHLLACAVLKDLDP